MSKSTAEVLREARELISDPERWTQGVVAVNHTGKLVRSESDKAVRWCAQGACERVGILTERDEFAAIEALDEVAREWGFLDAESGESASAVLNDHGRNSHSIVLAAFDRAIALAEAK